LGDHKITSNAPTPKTGSTRKERRLENQVAIISGGSGGIGQSTALLFANEGAKVAVHYSGLTDASLKRATEVSNKLKTLGFESMPVRANVSDYGEVKELVDKVVNDWGKVTTIVCYAGLPSSKQFWQEDPLELSDDELLSAINVDFLGSYHFIRAAKDYMRKQHYGKIVLISSSPTIYGEESGYRFILAKDLNRITVKSLAAKLIREYGVYLNVIAPGTVETHANRLNYDEEHWKKLTGDIPLGKAGRTEDIANVALFLCSHDSDYVVGQTIIADGGEIRL
jgi:NAD(P)-dependent dehydrogenase (short-subunit alcohol dehydrogenase family)